MNISDLVNLPEEMIIEIIDRLIDDNPENALMLCSSNTRLTRLCAKYNIRDKVYTRWVDIVSRMKEDARSELGDYYSEEEMDQLVSLHLLDNLPEMPEWLAEKLELI